MAPDRGKSNKPGASHAWDALNPPLSPWILDAVSSLGFSAMTPVQASTIPLFMGYKDVVVEAVTGSGKTLAFLIPIVEKLLRLDAPIPKHHVGVIVISPTRELAKQIHDVLLSLLEFHDLSATRGDSPSIENTSSQGNQEGVSKAKEDGSSFRLRIVPQLLVGGSSSPAQDLSKFLKMSPNLLVSTPGRLLEILSSPYVHCPQSSFEVLVLDEADRLLDLGFKEDLTKILNLLPKQRRTGLFSASVSEAVDQVIRVGLRNPVRIAVKVKGVNGAQDKRTPASLQMTYAVFPPAHKIPALSKLLRQLTPFPNKTIVYLSTCAAVDYFQGLLPSILPDGMLLVPMHGRQASNIRQKNFIRFTNSATPAILLTTDVAARGLDIPAVDLVVQLDPPSDPKVFLHRCGRAGRAGRKGVSVIFLRPGREEDYVSFLEVRQTPIEYLNSPAISVTDTEAAKITADFRNIVLSDRSHHDKAQKAFVSWVRSYSKHQASSIFRVADLDWAQLAEAWALLKIPKMPELKNWDQQGYRPVKIDWDNYAYVDKQHEKQRQEALAKFQAEGPSATKQDNHRKRVSTVAWSQKVERKAEKEEQRERKQARREYERKAKMTEAEKKEMDKTEQMVEKVREEQRQKRMEKDEVFQGFD